MAAGAEPGWEERKKEALKQLARYRDVRDVRDVLETLAEDLRADPNFMLAAYEIDGDAIEYANLELTANKAFMLEATHCRGSALQYASPELKADRAFVLEAVKSTGALKHASQELRADAVIVMEAVKHYAPDLQFASKELRADRNIVLESVKGYGCSLRYASEELRADKEIVLAALASSTRELSDASDCLKGDEEFVLEIVRRYGLDVFPWANHEYPIGPGKEFLIDKDLLLLAARGPEPGRYFECECSYSELVEVLESDSFLGAQHSAIAIRGEVSPIVTVTLLQFCNSTETGPTFRCEASLMSGRSLECYVPDEASAARPGVILNDLAEKIVADLPRLSEAAARVFINFATTAELEEGETEVRPVTPWDWKRPLSDFLPASR